MGIQGIMMFYVHLIKNEYRRLLFVMRIGVFGCLEESLLVLSSRCGCQSTYLVDKRMSQPFL